MRIYSVYCTGLAPQATDGRPSGTADVPANNAVGSAVLTFMGQRLRAFTDSFNPTIRIPMFYSIATLVVGLPQVAFALIGGFTSQGLEAAKPRNETRG
jgi:hypothetical protein